MNKQMGCLGFQSEVARMGLYEMRAVNPDQLPKMPLHCGMDRLEFIWNERSFI